MDTLVVLANTRMILLPTSNVLESLLPGPDSSVQSLMEEWEGFSEV